MLYKKADLTKIIFPFTGRQQRSFEILSFDLHVVKAAQMVEERPWQ